MKLREKIQQLVQSGITENWIYDDDTDSEIRTESYDSGYATDELAKLFKEELDKAFKAGSLMMYKDSRGHDTSYGDFEEWFKENYNS